MVIPTRYRKAQETQVNYDIVDVITDVGYITLFGFSDEADAKTLIRQTLPSTDISSRVTGTTGNVEVNFDFTFETADRVKGDLFVTITIFVDGSASNTAQNDTTIEIFHVDSGASETTIGTQQSIAQLNNPVDTAQDEARTTLTFAVDKFFAEGDKLRIEVISAVTSSNGNSFAGFYHDAINRDFSLVDQHGIATNSNLIVNVPFDLDL